MKIKIDKLKIVDESLSIEIENIDFEISTTELKEMNKSENYEFKGFNVPPMCPPQCKVSELFYSCDLMQLPQLIIENDVAEILSSEFCVTNCDEIKYDEKISGQICNVRKIFPNINQVQVKLKSGSHVFVHPSWLKFISK